jgi:hypothetical protein
MNIGKFNREKYNLIFYHVQTIQNADIHEVCGICGRILNGFWLFENCGESEKQNYQNKLLLFVGELNSATKSNYTLSDFTDEPKEIPA